MKIATWNVNSVKVRLPHLLDFLKSAQPDVLCLQEIKCLESDFPALEVRALGYHVEAIGQRAYNGVAILSKQPPQDIVRGLMGDDADDHARYLEASFHGDGHEVRVASIYLPNGNPTGDDVYDPVAFRNDALTQPESRARFRALLHLGLTDAFRVFHREPHKYTYWDYQAGRWSRDEGLRIDHLLLSPHAADRVAACAIDKSPRGKDRASDHTPIW